MDNRIIADIKQTYGLICHEISPVSGGYMNLKWRISTDNGDFLVKQFSFERYREKDIAKIEVALKRQIELKKLGVSCPYILQHNNNVIRIFDNIAYMLMEFCSGQVVTPNNITLNQMKNLGSACGLMHNAFSKLIIPIDAELPRFGGFSLDLLRISLKGRFEKCTDYNTCSAYKSALIASEKILNNINHNFFETLPIGFGHEDFQAGNVLFDGEKSLTILDFDRNCFTYFWHDIGRAILSFALEKNHLNTAKINAFLAGYNEYFPFTLSDIVTSLYLCWIIENEWWIQPQFFSNCGDVPKRFLHEMLWINEHWSDINN